MKNYTFALSAIALFGTALGPPEAFPVTPHSLRDLCDKADRIVYAEVERIEVDPEVLDAFERPQSFAVLKVLETIHGDSSATLRVAFEPYMTCPQPPRYLEGEQVLAFLTWYEDFQQYSTTGVSYGARVMPAEDAAIFGKHIRSYFALQRSIQKQEASTDSEVARRLASWWINLCEDRATRWEGVKALTSTQRMIRHPLRDVDLPRPTLTEKQIERIAQITFSGDVQSWPSTARLVPLLVRSGSPGTRAYLLRVLAWEAGKFRFERRRETGLFMSLLLQLDTGEAWTVKALPLLERFDETLRAPRREQENKEDREHRITQNAQQLLRSFLQHAPR